MSERKTDQIKKGKWFSLADLIVYALILAVAIALICVRISTKSGKALQGFEVVYKNDVILSFSFDDGTFSPTEGGRDNLVYEKVEDGFTLYFTTDDGDGKNEIFVNIEKRTVKITSSNCSTSRDCVYTSAISGEDSAPIICLPHALIIRSLTFTDSGNVYT